jgi:hypothetical protein
MKHARTALYALAVCALLVAAAGCFTGPITGQTGVGTIDNLTGQGNGSFRVAGVTPAMGRVHPADHDGVVLITVNFTGPVYLPSVVEGKTLIVTGADGLPIPGKVTRPAGNLALVIWQSQEVYREGGTYTLNLVGTQAGNGVIVAHLVPGTGMALDCDGTFTAGTAAVPSGIPMGDGLAGGNASITCVAN